jgi:hypothetical protein
VFLVDETPKHERRSHDNHSIDGEASTTRDAKNGEGFRGLQIKHLSSFDKEQMTIPTGQ